MIAASALCIALAVFFESRSEGIGQLAVAHVIRNRMADPRYPSDACAVVQQGRYWGDFPIRNQCQFSYYCDGKPEFVSPEEKQSYYNALYITELSETSKDLTYGATHYHATYITAPYWASTGQETIRINKHIFYKGIK